MSQENQSLIFSPSDFVAVANQVLDRAFGNFFLEGEIANLRISKNRWVYFDLKDDTSKVSCFGSVFNLSGPIEDGMNVVSQGRATLHPQYGFNFSFSAIKPSGEGSIKKAYELLKKKLEQEGMFEISRKRELIYPPSKIALITSADSAAYSDFIKILKARWPLVSIDLYDCFVQGQSAVEDLINGLNLANSENELADVLVMTRGGGSNDDMDAFNDERLVRAVAASRIPTLIAIGHEKDESLCELVADRRASTPSNAAELICPNLNDEIESFKRQEMSILSSYLKSLQIARTENTRVIDNIIERTRRRLKEEIKWISGQKDLIQALNPLNILAKGYSLLYDAESNLVKSIKKVKLDDRISVRLVDGVLDGTINKIEKGET